MFLINALAKPTKKAEQYDEVIGAYVSIYIDYKDIEGAYRLAKYYIKSEGWKATEIEEEYFTLESISDVDDDHIELYKEALEFGCSMIFNCFEEDDDE